MPRTHVLATAAILLLALLALPDASHRSPTGTTPSAQVSTATAPPPDPLPAVTPKTASAPTKTDAAAIAPLRDHADDIADYTLRARLDPTLHTVHGEGTIRFRNASDVPVHELWLHLYLNAFKNQRSVFLREPVGGFRGSAPLADWGTINLKTLSLRAEGGGVAGATDLLPSVELSRRPDPAPGAPGADDDETDARVPLPREVRPGESITLDVVWDDKLPSVVERTGYNGSFHFVGQWFPKLARLEKNGSWAHFPFHHLAEFYADFGTYDVTLDVPDTFTIGATGPVTESTREGGRLVERHVQADIHDFAWTAWDQYRTIEETVGDVRVKVLFPEGYDEDAERELRIVRYALPYFESRYGKYPYPVLTVVHPPEAASEAGGMEYPTLITTGGAWYGAPYTRLIELVTVHELGHQWFYGLLASNEELWPFLDEGVNSYAEADVLRAIFGRGSMVSAYGLTVTDEAVQAVVGNSSALDEPVAQPAHAFTTGGRYSALVYERTGAILETLRRVYGDDAMDRAMAAYTRAFRFEHPGPEDFIRSFADEMGGEAAATLRRALFEKGWVDYSVVEVASHPVAPARGLFDRDGKREAVTRTTANHDDFEGWVLLERRGTLRFPVQVELTFTDGRHQRVPWDGEAATIRIPFRTAVGLQAAVVDPDHDVLLDDDLTNNHASVAGAEGGGADRVFERATYWAELLVQGVGP